MLLCVYVCICKYMYLCICTYVCKYMYVWGQWVWVHLYDRDKEIKVEEGIGKKN